MIHIDKIAVYGFDAAIRGMRNPKNSWDRSDSYFRQDGTFVLGEADKKLAMNLKDGGSVHAKYRRMITVTMDIEAPLYWWKEFDTYKVGTVANSCSTMHKIHDKTITIADFSIDGVNIDDNYERIYSTVANYLEQLRIQYNVRGDKNYWRAIIQLLPSGYMQKRTVQLNYEVLSNIIEWRHAHKLTEWTEFCRIMLTELPYIELFAEVEYDSEGEWEDNQD